MARYLPARESAKLSLFGHPLERVNERRHTRVVFHGCMRRDQQETTSSLMDVLPCESVSWRRSPPVWGSGDVSAPVVHCSRKHMGSSLHVAPIPAQDQKIGQARATHAFYSADHFQGSALVVRIGTPNRSSCVFARYQNFLREGGFNESTGGG